MKLNLTARRKGIRPAWSE